MGDGHHHAGHGKQVLHHLGAGLGVKTGSDLVGDDEIVFAQGQPGDADALALAAGKIFAVLAQHRVKALGERCYPVGQACCRDGVGQLLVRKVFQQADVMAQGVVEDGRSLGNVPHPPVEGAAVDAAHLPAVEEDIAGVIRVILEQQLCQRGFAAAAFAHKGHFLGAGNFQCRVPQHGCCRAGVSKARVSTNDALDFADGFACFRFFRRGHGGFQPLADAFGGFDFRPALGDLVAGGDDEVCHAGGGGYGAYGQLTAESEEQAHQHHHREDEVADEGGVHYHGVEALLVAQLALSGLPGCVFVAGGVSVLPQKAPDDLKAAQQFFQLLSIIGHFQAESIPRRLQPLVHPAGQHQRRDGHQQDRRQHHGADVEVHTQCTQHDAAPEHEVEQGHIVVVVEGAQVGGEQGNVRCVALSVVLRDGAMQKLLHDAAAHLLHGPAG